MLIRSVLLNDNGIFEYVLQDDVFMGVVGMLECESHLTSVTATNISRR